MEQHENPIVFISYSQDSIAFADQVLSFSNQLRREGIDTIRLQNIVTVNFGQSVLMSQTGFCRCKII